MSQSPSLINDCFLHDKDRLRHGEVVELIVERLHRIVDTEDVRLDSALGRYLAESVTAPRNVPLHDNSAVDGYAFTHADYAKQQTLAVGARIPAGEANPPALVQGTAARIFTGAVMPPNADCVAMQEDCGLSEDGTEVTIPAGLRPGANRRLAGEDVKAGDDLLSLGQRLRPQDIAALASLGRANVGTYRRLKVAIVSTGDELVEPGQTDALERGQVFDSNRHMIASLCAGLPVELTDVGILRDDEDNIADALSKVAADHHVILTTGGASRGEEDHIVTTIDRLGKRHLWQIAIKPGRPMTFGQVGNCVFLGLPGNPVAAFVCFLLYCYPAMRLLGGGRHKEPQRFRIPAGFAIEKKKPDRRELVRGWLEPDDSGAMVARKFRHDGSGLISGLRSADGLIELDEQTVSVEQGDPVTYIPLSQFGISLR
ncbi:gephyrin-like molybdotransferase Glp [Hoeflea prorocentri]|uniref:Molybdopterin molybdenumtransferase n=1 Tax=Hoeflea prorocentri TaxID=1922333 RepID=A0A9X3ZGI7_9HYPH|nr:gephyrin-like molybdotransferase Glp [Hoeflea prorocentri]MCY6380279.1 molybdopterin molybdotransferase MoeA [Hoeflea prorocentri]MDA5398079.1 molybdopterin molybdotransferase MoeA [Hoeflea prorocentri]